jgi:putative RNA 2'-phosphotransferase
LKITDSIYQVKQAFLKMAQQKSPNQLAKLISYMLGHKPAEFGLVPDRNGFVKTREFLKAVCEEDGMGYIRESHIHEILITLSDPPIEIKDNFIRATHRDKLPGRSPAQTLPKLLYTCIRRKAYPFVLDKGIFPMGFDRVILSSMPEMAERIGKRKDRMPILLTVQTRKSLEKGTLFYEAGDTLFLAESIRPGCFTGPPLPKQKETAIIKEVLAEKKDRKIPGSFIMGLKDKNKKTPRRKKTGKQADWNKDPKKLKKQRRDPPPWRK